MPDYRFIFDTTDGKKTNVVTIPETEILGNALPSILDEMRERHGVRLRGGGEPMVIHIDRTLTLSQTLSDQKVLEGAELKVTSASTNG